MLLDDEVGMFWGYPFVPMVARWLEFRVWRCPWNMSRELLVSSIVRVLLVRLSMVALAEVNGPVWHLP